MLTLHSNGLLGNLSLQLSNLDLAIVQLLLHVIQLLVALLAIHMHTLDLLFGQV